MNNFRYLLEECIAFLPESRRCKAEKLYKRNITIKGLLCQFQIIDGSLLLFWYISQTIITNKIIIIEINNLKNVFDIFNLIPPILLLI